jgi:hypothetical protein
MLPNIVAIPVTVLTMPSANSPPPTRESIIAGRAALKMEAVKLITAKNRIKSKIPSAENDCVIHKIRKVRSSQMLSLKSLSVLSPPFSNIS